MEGKFISLQYVKVLKWNDAGRKFYKMSSEKFLLTIEEESGIVVGPQPVA